MSLFSKELRVEQDNRGEKARGSEPGLDSHFSLFSKEATRISQSRPMVDFLLASHGRVDWVWFWTIDVAKLKLGAKKSCNVGSLSEKKVHFTPRLWAGLWTTRTPEGRLGRPAMIFFEILTPNKYHQIPRTFPSHSEISQLCLEKVPNSFLLHFY